jgi:hypothetical protein
MALFPWLALLLILAKPQVADAAVCGPRNIPPCMPDANTQFLAAVLGDGCGVGVRSSPDARNDTAPGIESLVTRAKGWALLSLVRKGMTREQVESILGYPTFQHGFNGSWVWWYSAYDVTVEFFEGGVADSSYLRGAMKNRTGGAVLTRKAGCTVLAVILTPGWGTARRCRITRATAERIQPGMRLAEVETFLGGPAGDYRAAEVKLVFSRHIEFDNVMNDPDVLQGSRHYRQKWWQGDEGTLWVCFDEENQVVAKEFTPGVYEAPALERSRPTP